MTCKGSRKRSIAYNKRVCIELEAIDRATSEHIQVYHDLRRRRCALQSEVARAVTDLQMLHHRDKRLCIDETPIRYTSECRRLQERTR
jgi:hypothetical protein